MLFSDSVSLWQQHKVIKGCTYTVSMWVSGDVQAETSPYAVRKLKSHMERPLSHHRTDGVRPQAAVSLNPRQT